MILGNRRHTPDISYFAAASQDIDDITHARLNSQDLLPDYPPGWINSGMTSYALVSGNETLFEDSTRQAFLLYSSHVLQVFVADWRFLLVGSMKRIDEQGRSRQQRQDDLADAVSILHRLVLDNNGQPLASGTIRQWYCDGRLLKDDHVARTNAEYRKRYGTNGVRL